MEDHKEDEQDKKDWELVLGAAKRIKDRRKFDDGYTSLKEPGDSLMPGWPIGHLVASMKELSEAFDMKPWMNGSKASGCSKGKFLFQFAFKDSASVEWVFSLEHPFETMEKAEEAHFDWRVDSIGHVAEIGDVLANRLRRDVVMYDLDRGEEFRFKYVAPPPATSETTP